MREKEVYEAYIWLRANNNTIPSEVLDEMKDTLLKEARAERIIEKIKNEYCNRTGTIGWLEVLLDEYYDI